jgi:hypothetical protein
MGALLVRGTFSAPIFDTLTTSYGKPPGITSVALSKKFTKEWAETVDISKTMCYNSVTFAERRNNMATESKNVLQYKGRPLMRKDNVIYYGSMSDPYIVMMQILETKKVGDEDVASKVSVQLQLTDPNVKSRDRVTKRSEKDGLFSALDVGSVWLERALSK